jgi:predicted hydrocarbon binding protein
VAELGAALVGRFQSRSRDRGNGEGCDGLVCMSETMTEGLPGDSAVESPEPSGGAFPSKMGRIVLLSLQDVMGENALNTVLNMARLQDYVGNFPPNNFEGTVSFDELGRLLQALEQMYGVRSGRGLARKAGRAAFRLGVRDFGPLLGLADLSFRILPLGMRLRIGLEVLAETFNKFTDHSVRVVDDDRYLRWTVDRCGVSWGRRSETPCCHLSVGIIEEALYWVSGGRTFYVEEVACVATGDPACVILTGKSPLE